MVKKRCIEATGIKIDGAEAMHTGNVLEVGSGNVYGTPKASKSGMNAKAKIRLHHFHLARAVSAPCLLTHHAISRYIRRIVSQTSKQWSFPRPAAKSNTCPGLPCLSAD